MSEVEGLAELGLLPNQLKHTQPASADSISIEVTIPTAQHGNLTGPTSYAGEPWCKDAKQPPGHSGWGRIQAGASLCTFAHFCGAARELLPVTHPKDKTKQKRKWGESEHSCGLEKLSSEASSILSPPNRFLMQTLSWH